MMPASLPRPALTRGRGGSWRCVALLFAACLVQAAPSGRPQPDSQNPRQIEEAERARAAELAAQNEAKARADAAATEEKRLAQQLVSAAARLRDTERAVAEAASRMDALARRRREAEAKLNARVEDLAPLLPIMQRLSVYPAETILALPANSDDAVSGVVLLHGIAREIDQQASALRRDQAEVNQAEREVAAEAPRLASAEALQSAEAAALDKQIAAVRASRRDAEGEAEQAARRAAEQATQADTLRAAIARIEAERRADKARTRAESQAASGQRQAPETPRGARWQHGVGRPRSGGTLAALAAPHGQLTAPVIGTVIRAWGAATDAGPAAGVSYRAAPHARVVSPCQGRVEFAAPFRSYGLLLILDCGGGYHFVLAGLDRLDVSVDHAVQAGEPVGVMPGWDPRVPGNRPALYVELRRGGHAIDPAPWLVARS
jgi:murein hydrolase activator